LRFSYRLLVALVRGVIRLQSAGLWLLQRLLFPRQTLSGTPGAVLVYRTGRLGDFINAIPALSWLHERFPAARITLLTTCSTQKSMQTLTKRYLTSLRELPWLDFVVPSVVDKACVFSLEDGWRGWREVREAVKTIQPECMFFVSAAGESFRSRAKKLLFARLAGVRGPVYGWRMRSNRYFLPHVQYRAGLFEHQAQAGLRAVGECPALAGIEEQEVAFPIAVDPASTAWADELLSGLGWTDKLLLAVAPGATFEHKRWPVYNYVHLCRILQSRKAVRFAVIGAGSEAALGDQLAEALGPACLNLAGQTSLRQLAALLRRCVLLVGNDGGPAHLASALGCPCVTVTSALDFPIYWEPWNSRGRAVREVVPCQFCLDLEKCPLGTNACILSVKLPDVLGACERILDGMPPPNPTTAAQLEDAARLATPVAVAPSSGGQAAAGPQFESV